ncbi:hypothetical protein ACP70R_024632 [Stipagrostis hirtigluma subsp. patula]
MASAPLNPHEKMRGRDVGRVARGEQAPRPSHELGSVADSPPVPEDVSVAGNPPAPDTGSVADTPPAPTDKADASPVIELRTAPTDFRFPTQNQTRHCYVRYLEYHRCVKVKDAEHRSECDKFQRYYRSLCPTDWVVEWNRQREEGIFPGPI